MLRQAKDLNKRDDLLRSSIEKEGFALQRAPLGNGEAIRCRGARACTSHAARREKREDTGKESGGEEHPSFCAKQKTSTNTMIC